MTRYEVSRNGVRWGTYETQAEAEAELAKANKAQAGHEIMKVIRIALGETTK